MNYNLFLPEIFLTFWAFLLLTLSLTFPQKKNLLNWLSFIGFLLTLLLTGAYFHREGPGFYGMLEASSFIRIFDLIFLLAGALVTLIFVDYFTETKRDGIFFLYTSTLGMMLFAKSSDLVMVFLSLEVISFSFFYLIGLLKTWERSQEALLKFFILSLFSSSLFLMGITLLYGELGTTSFTAILNNFPDHPSFALLLSLVFLLVGFGFKLVFVPFHLWTPDVFYGAPVPVVAFLTGAPKAAGFAALFNLLNRGFGGLSELSISILFVLSLLTMLAGNLAALREPDIKRMLAYSTVAHAGYILVAFVADNRLATLSIPFYLFVYVFMTLGAFATLSLIGENVDLSRIKGLARKNPGIALALSLFLLSLASIPPTAGFIAKFQVFMSAVQSGYTTLALFGFFNSVVAVFYYVRVVAYMYMEPEEEPITTLEVPWAYSVIWTGAFFIVLFGIYPSPLITLISSTF